MKRPVQKIVRKKVVVSKVRTLPAATVSPGTLFLDDRRLFSVLRNPQVTAAFPFLAAAVKATAKRRTGCGSCGRRTVFRTGDYNAIRQQIAGLPDEQKLALKRVLGAKQLVLRYLRPSGEKVQLTF